MKSAKQLSEAIRETYRSSLNEARPEEAELLIENLILANVKEISGDNLLAFWDNLCKEFEDSPTGSVRNSGAGETDGPEILSLILGKKISADEFSTPEFQDRITESFNTIFNSLNNLIRLMNLNLLSGESDDETIRTVIGSHLEGQDRLKSLEAYITQIEKTFLVIQKAFKNAALTIINRMLSELDPKYISRQSSSSLKIGPLKKAEWFDIYEHRYQTLRKWLESGRVTEELLREFEKKCQKLSV